MNKTNVNRKHHRVHDKNIPAVHHNKGKNSHHSESINVNENHGENNKNRRNVMNTKNLKTLAGVAILAANFLAFSNSNANAANTRNMKNSIVNTNYLNDNELTSVNENSIYNVNGANLVDNDKNVI
jgi:hypothetical protein